MYDYWWHNAYAFLPILFDACMNVLLAARVSTTTLLQSAQYTSDSGSKQTSILSCLIGAFDSVFAVHVCEDRHA